MSNPLTIVAIIAVVIAALLLLFMIMLFLAPGILAGTLSEAVPQPCNQGKQWILYDCQPNPITGFGCIVPGSHGRNITYKTVAVQNNTCLPDTINGDVSGERVISFVWQEMGTAGICSSPPANVGCCEYNSSCTSTVRFLCVRTNQPVGGENQCTPQYLPAPFPGYEKGNNYNDPLHPAVVEVPCRSNYCH